MGGRCLPRLTQLPGVSRESLHPELPVPSSLPDQGEEQHCFLFHAGAVLGSSRAPAAPQAPAGDQGGAYEVVSASLLNGDVWDPVQSAAAEVGGLLLLFCCFLTVRPPKLYDHTRCTHVLLFKLCLYFNANFILLECNLCSCED